MISSPASRRERVSLGVADRANTQAFYLAYTATTVSAVGTAVTTVALPLLAVLSLHASTFAVSAIAATGVAPWLILGLPAGVIVSRFPLRGSLVTADLVRALALASVPVAWGLGVLTVAQLLVVALTVGVFTVIFDVAFSTFLPSVVPAEALTARNSLVQGSESMAQIGGPAGGGALVQIIGGAATILVDVSSYLVSAACLFALRSSAAESGRRAGDRAADHRGAADHKTGFFKQMVAGLSYVRHDKVVGPQAAGAAALNFTASGIMAIAAVFLVRSLHLHAWTVGALLASDGVGGVLGAAIATPLVGKLGRLSAASLTIATAGASALLLPLTFAGAGVIFWVVGSVGLAGSTVAFSIVARTYRQLNVPMDMLPRVMATVRFLSWGVLPLGGLTAGALGQTVGIRPALAIVCVPLLCGILPVSAARRSGAPDVGAKQPPVAQAQLPIAGEDS